MGMQSPNIGEPLDRLSDVYPEGERFYIEGIRTVKANSQEYGPGEMVVIRVRGHERELGVWGAYLLAQAKSHTPEDLNKWYVLERRKVEGFGKGRPVKILVPYVAPGQDDDSVDFLDAS